MKDMPNSDCKYWHCYLDHLSCQWSSREQTQDKKRAKNTETNDFLRILCNQPDQEDNSLRFARAFARWEARCHLHKTKDEQSQQGQYSSNSESDDVDFQPPPNQAIPTDETIYNARFKKVLLAVKSLSFSLRGFNLIIGGIYQCPLMKTDRAQKWRKRGKSTS